jgi:hypothetical protein
MPQLWAALFFGEGCGCMGGYDWGWRSASTGCHGEKGSPCVEPAALGSSEDERRHGTRAKRDLASARGTHDGHNRSTRSRSAHFGPAPRAEYLVVFKALGGLDRGRARGHAGFTSNVMPVSRSETSQSLAIASRCRARPNIGRRTGGPQFTQRGV